MSKLVVSKNGFTLVEIIVVVALFGLAILVAYNLLFFCTRSFSDVVTQAMLHRNARLASSIIVNEVRNAKAVSVSTSQEGLGTDDQLDYTTVFPIGSDERRIKVEAGELSVSELGIQLDAVFDTISFDIEDEILEVAIVVAQGRQLYKLTTSVFLQNFNNIESEAY